MSANLQVGDEYELEILLDAMYSYRNYCEYHGFHTRYDKAGELINRLVALYDKLGE